jgi:hypothetical protein
MIATSGHRPARVGCLPSVDPGSGGARWRRGTRSPLELRSRTYGLFASSSGCQRRPSHRGAGSAGALSLHGNLSGALGKVSRCCLFPCSGASASCSSSPRAIGSLRSASCSSRRDGDLLKDAHALFDSGNLIAAAMTARVELERQLTTLALMNPSFGDEWRGIFTTAAWLHKRLVIRQNAFNLVTEAGDIGNLAAHGGAVTKIEVARMFNAVDSLRHTVRRKGGAT